MYYGIVVYNIQLNPHLRTPINSAQLQKVDDFWQWGHFHFFAIIKTSEHRTLLYLILNIAYCNSRIIIVEYEVTKTIFI